MMIVYVVHNQYSVKNSEVVGPSSSFLGSNIGSYIHSQLSELFKDKPDTKTPSQDQDDEEHQQQQREQDEAEANEQQAEAKRQLEEQRKAQARHREYIKSLKREQAVAGDGGDDVDGEYVDLDEVWQQERQSHSQSGTHITLDDGSKIFMVNRDHGPSMPEHIAKQAFEHNFADAKIELHDSLEYFDKLSPKMQHNVDRATKHLVAQGLSGDDIVKLVRV